MQTQLQAHGCARGSDMQKHTTFSRERRNAHVLTCPAASVSPLPPPLPPPLTLLVTPFSSRALSLAPLHVAAANLLLKHVTYTQRLSLLPRALTCWAVMLRGTGSPILRPPPWPQQFYRLLFADIGNEIKGRRKEGGIYRPECSDDSYFSPRPRASEGRSVVIQHRVQSEATK